MWRSIRKKSSKWKRFFMWILISHFGLVFTGCTGETVMPSVSEEKQIEMDGVEEQEKDTQTDGIEEKTELVEQEDIEEKEIDVIALLEEALLNTDSICGVIYCGNVEGQKSLSKEKEILDEILRKGNYGKNYDFIRKLPKKRIIELEGGKELYYIYPYDPEAKITVSQCTYNEKTEEIESGKVLYESKKGTPFLIRCNVEKGENDILIHLISSNGEELKWSPSVNPDGTVIVPERFPFVLDATEPVK